jgi:hypothetical protein
MKLRKIVLFLLLICGGLGLYYAEHDANSVESPNPQPYTYFMMADSCRLITYNSRGERKIWHLPEGAIIGWPTEHLPSEFGQQANGDKTKLTSLF